MLVYACYILWIVEAVILVYPCGILDLLNYGVIAYLLRVKVVKRVYQYACYGILD